MSAHNPTDTFERDPFIGLSAVALPLANVGLWAAIRYTGGAHGHGLLIGGSVVGAETVLITWFCATRTKRKTATSLIGAVLNVTVSAAAIMLVTLIVLAIGFAGGRAGD